MHDERMLKFSVISKEDGTMDIEFESPLPQAMYDNLNWWINRESKDLPEESRSAEFLKQLVETYLKFAAENNKLMWNSTSNSWDWITDEQG